MSEIHIIANHVSDRLVVLLRRLRILPLCLTKLRLIKPWGDKVVEVRKVKCTKNSHNVVIVKYEDSSIWIQCPNFGLVDSQLVCRLRKLVADSLKQFSIRKYSPYG